MKHVNIQEDFILGHHNLKAGQYGYEPSRDCRRTKNLRQYAYEKQTI